jgi:hypothetical protein
MNGWMYACDLCDRQVSTDEDAWSWVTVVGSSGRSECVLACHDCLMARRDLALERTDLHDPEAAA